MGLLEALQAIDRELDRCRIWGGQGWVYNGSAYRWKRLHDIVRAALDEGGEG